MKAAAAILGLISLIAVVNGRHAVQHVNPTPFKMSEICSVNEASQIFQQSSEKCWGNMFESNFQLELTLCISCMESHCSNQYSVKDCDTLENCNDVQYYNTTCDTLSKCYQDAPCVSTARGGSLVGGFSPVSGWENDKRLIKVVDATVHFLSSIIARDYPSYVVGMPPLSLIDVDKFDSQYLKDRQKESNLIVKSSSTKVSPLLASAFKCQKAVAGINYRLAMTLKTSNEKRVYKFICPAVKIYQPLPFNCNQNDLCLQITGQDVKCSCYRLGTSVAFLGAIFWPC